MNILCMNCDNFASSVRALRDNLFDKSDETLLPIEVRLLTRNLVFSQVFS